MGASGWDYVTNYKDDLPSSLDALQTEVFASEPYFREELAKWGLPQPLSLDELWSEQYYEFLGTNGTHSVLDVDINDLRPLTARELVETFGTEQPTRADWARVAGEYATGVQHLMDSDRGTGRSAILYLDGKPEAVAFWGFSGD